MISPSPLELDVARGGRARRRHFAAYRAAQRLDVRDAAITIRSAEAEDAPAIAHLALLEGRRLPEGKRLVAEAGGRILAAAEIASGTTIADPFEPTAAVARLVALRAQQLRPRAA
jgi:hypothetical protein